MPGDCAKCGRPEARKRCARCREAVYCGRECQRAHWAAGHRRACRAPREQRLRAAREALAAALPASAAQPLAALLDRHSGPLRSEPVDVPALLARPHDAPVTLEALALSVLVLLQSHDGALGLGGAAVLALFDALHEPDGARRLAAVCEAARPLLPGAPLPLLPSVFALRLALEAGAEGAAERLAALVRDSPDLRGPVVRDFFKDEADAALVRLSAPAAASAHAVLFGELLELQAREARPPAADGSGIRGADVVFLEFVNAFFKVMAPVLDPATARLTLQVPAEGLFDASVGRLISVVRTTAADVLQPRVLVRVRLMALRMRRDGNEQGARTSLLQLELLRRCYALGIDAAFERWREDAAAERLLGADVDSAMAWHDALLEEMGWGLP